jgi:hypothetical protein
VSDERIEELEGLNAAYAKELRPALERVVQLEAAIREHRERFRNRPQAPADLRLWRNVDDAAPTDKTPPHPNPRGADW